jgi:hypothetical protein
MLTRASTHTPRSFTIPSLSFFYLHFLTFSTYIMPVTSEVTSLDIPGLHQSILKENEKEDDGKNVIYILKELDDNEV